MSFRENKNQQIKLSDRVNNLTKRERRILEKSWAKPFAEQIFPLIDESKFAKLYCEDNGRPNTPVNIIIGALFLKEIMTQTDEELMESIILDHRYQYALHLTSYDEIPFSDRTVSRFRERLALHEIETDEDILKEEIERLAGAFAEIMQIRGDVKRVDSLMISSSCKRMGRLELMYTCVANLVKAMIKADETHLLPDHMLKYAESSNKNAVCYRMKEEEIGSRLKQVLEDALLIYELAATAQDCTDDFQLLERMLYDQTKDGQLKPNKEISPQSLQNPSDEDATYRKKGSIGYQGYVANIVEDCGEKGNIITMYAYDTNRHTDVEFAAELIEELGPQEEKVTIITDGAYPSDENFDAAEANNMELVATALTGHTPLEHIVRFNIEDSKIIACPAGEKPVSSSYIKAKEQYRATFLRESCANCPLKAGCPAKIYKTKATVAFTDNTFKRAGYIKKLKTETYKAYARKRNGIEGMPSVLRRRYRVDEMPVRGLVRSKMWFGFKVGAINIKRLIRFVADQLKSPSIALFFSFLLASLGFTKRDTFCRAAFSVV